MQTAMGAFSFGWEDNYNGESVGMTPYQLLTLNTGAGKKTNDICFRPVTVCCNIPAHIGAETDKPAKYLPPNCVCTILPVFS